MSTITSLASTDNGSVSRSTINTNFTNLNTDKIETSVLDTDTTLAANSDSKVATQKAVKAYVDAGGNPNASTTQKGLVEEATQAEINAGTATGGTGARLFINPSTLAGSNFFSKVGGGATTKDVSSTTSTTIAHGLGVTPRYVRISAVLAANDGVCIAEAQYLSAQTSWYLYLDKGTGTNMFAAATFTLRPFNTANYTDGTVTVDSTNITISWSKTGVPTGTANLNWSAFA
jgi:hypothetical protein